MDDLGTGREDFVEAGKVVAKLDLKPHPEGGWFRETWREPSHEGGRDLATGILFLLEKGQSSHWHRVDAAEMWIYNAGGPLRLSMAAGQLGENALPDIFLGADLMAGQLAQHLIPAWQWQAAETLGAWTLATCIVSPGFDFAGFELAPPDWLPLARR